MSLVAIAAGALSGVLFALKDVFSKRAIEKNGLENALFYMYFALWSPFAIYLFLFSGFQGYTAEAWNTGLFVGGGLALGYFFFFKAIEAGKVAVSGALAELWVVFTVISAALFLGESIRELQILGMLFSLAAIVLLNSKGSIFSKSSLYALSAAVVWGFSWFAIKPLLDSSGVIASFVLYTGVGVFAFFAYSLLSRKLSKPDVSLVIPAGLLASAYLIEIWAISFSTVSLVSVAYSPAYVFTVSIATRAMLGEKLEKMHYVAFALIAVAIVLISIG